MLTILSLCLVSLPSLLSIAQRPYTYIFAMWFFCICTPFAIILLAFAYYFSAFTEKSPPDRSVGIGNLLGVVAIVSLGIFLFGNILSDKTSAPRITNLTSSDYTPAPGEIVIFRGEAQDSDGDDLSWRWEIRPAPGRGPVARLPGPLRSTYWRVPADPRSGQYQLVAIVGDGRRFSAPRTIEFETRSASDTGTSTNLNEACEC